MQKRMLAVIHWRWSQLRLKWLNAEQDVPHAEKREEDRTVGVIHRLLIHSLCLLSVYLIIVEQLEQTGLSWKAHRSRPRSRLELISERRAGQEFQHFIILQKLLAEHFDDACLIPPAEYWVKLLSWICLLQRPEMKIEKEKKTTEGDKYVTEKADAIKYETWKKLYSRST